MKDSRPETDQELLNSVRTFIKSCPEAVLDDPDTVRELATSAEHTLGENVVDLRDAALKILERRRGELEEVNRLLVASGHENLMSVQRVHAAVLALLEAKNLKLLRIALDEEITRILQVECIRLLLVGRFDGLGTRTTLGNTFLVCEQGFIDRYFADPRGLRKGQVKLRHTIDPWIESAYGQYANQVRSEALLPISFLNPHQSALLLIASNNAHQFEAGMGTELLVFFQQVFQHTIRKLMR